MIVWSRELWREEEIIAYFGGEKNKFFPAQQIIIINF
jgi:hypothetical protein